MRELKEGGEYAHVERECAQIDQFFAHPLMQRESPLRTEWTVFAVYTPEAEASMWPQGLPREVKNDVETYYALCGDADARPLVICAGQIDLCTYRSDPESPDGVARDASTGHPIATMWDFKRVKSPIDREERAFMGKRGKRSPMDRHPATDFWKMSLQQSMYSLMAEWSHGVRFDDRLNLVRVFPTLHAPEIVPCADLRDEARLVFAYELQRAARIRIERALSDVSLAD